MQTLELSKNNNRTAILKAAERLFSRNGYRATTLREISAKSGANGALVSYYFGNKEGLREAVVQKKLERLEEILSTLEKCLTKEDLRAAVRKTFAHIRKDEHFHRLAQRALVEDQELKKAITNKLWQPLFDKLSEAIVRASEGKNSKDQAETKCLVLCAMFHQYANLCWFHKGDLKTNTSAEMALTNFENYVADSIVGEICKA